MQSSYFIILLLLPVSLVLWGCGKKDAEHELQDTLPDTTWGTPVSADFVGPEGLIAGDCGGPFSVVLKSEDSAETKTSVPLASEISSTGGKIYADAGCLIENKNFTINAGSSRQEFYFKDPTIEKVKIFLSIPGLTNATKSLEIFHSVFVTISDGSTYDFGPHFIASTTDKTLIVTNFGKEDAKNISSSALLPPFQFKGGAYPGEGGSCTNIIAPARSCSIVISFTPSSVGTFSGTVELTYLDREKLVSASRPLTGQGVNSGSLDLTFGNSGKLAVPIGNRDDRAFGAAIQEDGKIVLGGYAFSPTTNYDFALVRISPEGVLDSTFGTAGKVITALSASNDRASGIAIQPDGKILAVGYTLNGSNYDFAVTRYDSAGMLDPAFGAGGKVTIDFASSTDYGFGIALDLSGRIVVGGYAYNGSKFDFALARLMSNGSLDPSFNGTGKLTTSIGNGSSYAYALAMQSDGKIIAAGSSYNNNHNFTVARYTEDGGLDSSFGTAGKAIIDFGIGDDIAYAIALDSVNNIVVAGRTRSMTQNVFGVVRLKTDGSLDSSFAGGGKTTTKVGTTQDEARSVAVMTNGKIITSGFSYSGATSTIALVRYLSQGTLDTSFGINGIMTTGVGGSEDRGYAMALSADGKIVVGGDTFNGNDFDFAVCRYYP
ncbi:MAG: hypothetical protein HY537_16960 [Deltaproteobacteria bacterium]|nr:hypothetical protein [Deltaproteobacteria bacterium]